MIQIMFQHYVDRVNEDEKNCIEILAFRKDVPYIMDLTFTKYDLKKPGNQLQVIQFPNY